MRKLCILHFQEIEKYPPTVNLLRFLHQRFSEDLLIEVLTTGGSGVTKLDIPGIQIHRLAFWKKKSNKLSRMFLYLRFNFLAIMKLLRFSPPAILYYETLSCGPAWFYKKFVRRSCAIFVHYHEYVTKGEYEKGMLLSKWLYKKEKQLLPHTSWVSHTNADRLALFLKDVNGYRPPHTYILPNYPPASWKKKVTEKEKGRIGFVYVGALSVDTMYLKEMADYVTARQQLCYWDVYSSNVSAEVLSFFKSYAGSNISFKGAVAYDELPGIVSTYNVGLILYKGHIPNYVYNIPNKLFEYHVCGLDVWLPASMKSSLALVTKNSYPKIKAIDFQQLDSVDLHQLVDRSGLVLIQQDYFCEDVFQPLAEKLTNGDAA